MCTNNNKRFSKWVSFIFIFLLTSFPIVYKFWQLIGIAPVTEFLFDTFKKSIAHGELSFVSLSVLASNICTLFNLEHESKNGKYAMILLSIFLCLFSISAYLEVNSNNDFSTSLAFHTF